MRNSWRCLMLGGLVLGGGAAAWGSGALGQDQGFFASGTASLTAAQAARGKAIYADNCVSCHGTNLDDGEFGPALKGTVFKANWSGQSPAALFSFIATKMPPSAAGSLSPRDTADVEAYILSENGVPAGTTELPPIQAQTAPRPPRRGGARDAIYKATMTARQSLLAAMKPVTDAMLRHPADGDWLIWRRTYQNISFSPLKRIDKANVRDLGVAWTLTLPVSANEITPLVHDGVLFIQSAGTVEALDAVTGEQLWQFVRPLPGGLKPSDSRMKTMAIYQDKLFAPTTDGHMLALDIATGKLIWDHVVINSPQAIHEGATGNPYWHLDGGPLVASGKVIVGVSLGTSQGGGDYIVGLDAQTGNEVWRFNTIPQPGQPGGDSWNGAPHDQRFGAGVWTSGSYDPDLNLVYFGTGNTYDVGTLLLPQARKGESSDALYTDSTLALNADTGKLAWYYQHMQRDVWDLDWVFEQELVTLPVNGKPTNLVVTGGKPAIFDAMQRADGKYVFSRDLGLQNVVTKIDPVTGKKTTDPALEPVPGKTVLLCPNSNGARNWTTAAFDPSSHILYVPLVETCADYSWTPRSPTDVAKGGVDIHFATRPRPDSDGKFGRIQAVDLVTGKTVWMHRQRVAMASSLLATAGGLLFSGDEARLFSAYDSASGKLLWQTRLNSVPSASPITYAVKGQQYVAVVGGGGGPLDSGGAGLTPELYDPPGGTTLWVFKLKGK